MLPSSIDLFITKKLVENLFVKPKLFIYALTTSLLVIERTEIKVEVPEDLNREVEQVSETDWSLAVSRLIKEKFENI